MGVIFITSITDTSKFILQLSHIYLQLLFRVLPFCLFTALCWCYTIPEYKQREKFNDASSAYAWKDKL